MSEFILIDGKNSIYRHQNVNNHLSREDGFPTGAIYGCLNSMLALAKRMPDAGIAWVWDGRGDTWRHKFMTNMPQLDAKEFPEPELDEDDPITGMGPSNYVDNMAQNSMEFLGLDKPDKGIVIRTGRVRKRGYKAQRNYKEVKKKKNEYPETPRERALLQLPVLRMILEGCGIRNYEVDSLECDDLLAMLAKRIIDLDEDSKVYIHSGDRDFYQLLAWDQVRIITRLKEGKIVKIKAEDVESEYGVKPKHWSKFRALTGDSSDNIPHLYKVGAVRARQMLADGLDPSLSDCKAIPEEIKEKYAKYFQPHGVARMWPSLHGNYKLCRLVTDPDDDLLSKEVREKLEPIFRHLDSIKRFYRRDKCKTALSYRKVSFVLSRYELASILARRETLWAIP